MSCLGRVVIGARYVINCEITFWTSTRLGALHRFVSAMEQIQIRYFSSCSLSVGVVHRLLINYFMDHKRKNTVAYFVRATALKFFDLRSVRGEIHRGHITHPPYSHKTIDLSLDATTVLSPVIFFF